MREGDRNAGRSEAWNPSRKERDYIGGNWTAFYGGWKIRKNLYTLKQKNKKSFSIISNNHELSFNPR